MRKIVRIVVPLLLLFLGIQTIGAQASEKASNSFSPKGQQTISKTSFGIHSYQGKPEVKAGAYRLNCYPLWSTTNPAPGVYDWTLLDEWVAKIESYGYKDILYSFCGTPEWAAESPLPNPERPGYYGPLANAAPSNMSFWRQYVRALVERYRGRITGYETWNEATSPYLWQGGAKKLATMTKILHEEVKRIDPSARVSSANVQTVEQPGWFKSFFPQYLKALGRQKWPVDVISIHSYAGSQNSSIKTPIAKLVSERPKMLRLAREYLAQYRVPPRIQLWDTETNYIGNFSPEQQQALLAHTFLDSWQYGISRTYWYMWTLTPDIWLGIPLMPNTPATAAYNRLVSWTRGAKLQGCESKNKGLVSCGFTRGNKNFQIAFTAGINNLVSYPLSPGSQVCSLTSSKCNKPRVESIKVGFTPILID